MFIGFDYGTANCSVASMQGEHPQLIALEHDRFYIPSTLAAPTRDSVTEHLFLHRHIAPMDPLGEQLLRRSVAANREEGIDLQFDDVVFGQAALDRYLSDPQQVYYVKSPKSFLGSIGLHAMQLRFFEDLVCAMMANIKTQAETRSNTIIDQAVIGRPVNFQGRGGANSNRQAENILRQAATRAGFRQLEFQFEPVAAGLEYEATLNQDKTVLVVDIGGGTTDCSLLRMGPSWRGKADRSQSLIAHTGQRVGGNDLDIHLAFKQLMTPFGFGSQTQSGLDMPITQFWNPIAINDVSAQSKFFARENLADLKRLHKEAREPEKLARLLAVYQDKLGYSLVKKAEEAKIALSDLAQVTAQIKVLSEQLDVAIAREAMMEAIETPKSKMIELVSEAVTLGGVMPDVIFMTGGSARSPILRAGVEQALPNIPVVSGNYFGSVTAGLARWAQVCFR
ncbi:molecular chaperone [Vibrio misgurnus]|uniref:molecular chaperone n=1 Tax=Vibrio misgurnus TaxID=2993714 RepID=UPI0023F78EA7|nr:molecular chaperone [Vibrio sp. VCS]